MRGDVRDLVAAIDEFQELHGFPPSLRDLSMALDCGVSAVFSRVRKAERLGLLTYVPGTARSLTLLPAGLEMVDRRTADEPVKVRVRRAAGAA